MYRIIELRFMCNVWAVKWVLPFFLPRSLVAIYVQRVGCKNTFKSFSFADIQLQLMRNV